MARRIVKWLIPAALAVALFFVGYFTGQFFPRRDEVTTEVKLTGILSEQTTRILAATVNNLQAENKLIVYQYTGDVRVAAEQSDLGGLIKTSQELTVPATVSYFVDLSLLRPEHVRYDEKSQMVFVKLPPLMISDPAFQPERSRTANGGLLTLNADIVHELNKLNYRTARKTFRKQANQKQFVDLARASAQKHVEAYFEIPLRIVGSPNIKVSASF